MKITKEKLKRARTFYGVSCARMSIICGFGVNQWRLYEQGQKPSHSNSLLISIVLRPSGMLKILSFSAIPDKIKKRILLKIDKFLNDCEIHALKIKDELDSTYFDSPNERSNF